jgi:hypothetical protein
VIRRCRWCRATIPARERGGWRSAYLRTVVAAHRLTCPVRARLERFMARGHEVRAAVVRREIERGS